MRIGAAAILATVGLVASGAVAWLIIRQGKSAAAAVGTVVDQINPTNPNNAAARTVNAVVQAVTGDPSASLGTKVFEWLNPGTVARESQITAPTPMRSPVIIKAADLAATYDRDDAALGSAMRSFEYFDAVDRADAELGAAMIAAQGPYLSYTHLTGKRR